MNDDAALTTFPVVPGTAIAQSQPLPAADVTFDAPALSVLTDLTQVRAATVHPGTLLPQAEQMMIYLGVRMLFVVSEMPAIAGLITTTDLHGETQMRRVHERQVHYDELCVGDVMTGLDMLDAIDFERLQRSTVGDVIATIRKCARNHLLVVEQASAKTPLRVRGVISRAQVERQVGVPISIAPIAASFAEIGRALS